MPSIVASFLAALDAAGAVVAAEEVRSSWDEPSALEGFTVGALVAHLLVATDRTLVVLEADPPAAGSVLVDVPAFYGPNRIDSPADLEAGLPAFLRRDAAERAAVGHAAVVGAFLGLSERLRPGLHAAGPDRLVPVVQVPGGAARLEDYLVTRVVELVVHTDDLACSVGLESAEPTPEVLGVVTAACLELAVARSGGRAVVRAFTRRERAGHDVLRVL